MRLRRAMESLGLLKPTDVKKVSPLECPHLQTDMFGRCEHCFAMLTPWRDEDLEVVTLIRRERKPIQPDNELTKLSG